MGEPAMHPALCQSTAASSTAAATALVALNGLSLRGGPRTLVQTLDWRIAAGECWAVLGANGAGKSSLLAALAGVQDPASGSVTWTASDRLVSPALNTRAASRRPGQPATLTIKDARTLAHLRAYLPQQVSDAFGASVLDTVLLGRYAHGSGLGWEDEADLACARAALVSVALEAFGHRDVRSLSGGERQRVAIAMLLVQDASLMLLDEPLSHQDPGQQMAIGALLAAYAAGAATGARGATAAMAPPSSPGPRAVVMALHDVNHALRFASHALVLLPGGVSVQGRSHEVVNPAVLERAYGHPFRALRDGEFTWMAPA